MTSLRTLLGRRAVLAFTAGLASWALVSTPALAETVRGNGRSATETRAVSGFTGVALSLPGQVEVRIGQAEGLTIEADENLLPLIETRVKDGVLEIRSLRNRVNLEPKLMKFIVQARRIDSLSVGGSGSIVADALSSPRLELEVGGSGNISVKKADSQEVSVSVGGSGNVNLGGVARNLSILIGGSGGVAAGELRADGVDVSIGGSGDATVWARNTLKMSVAGSGNVSYYGDPAVRQTVIGSGRAKRLGGAPR